MADTGAPHNLPYPVPTDAPNGPAQIQALAVQVAARLNLAAVATPRAYAEDLTNQGTSVGPLSAYGTARVSITLPRPMLGFVYATAEVSNTASTGTIARMLVMRDDLPGQIGASIESNFQLPTWGAVTTVPGSAFPLANGPAVGVETGGPWVQLLAAGTHTFDVRVGRYAGTGTSYIRNRRLWVWTEGF